MRLRKRTKIILGSIAVVLLGIAAMMAPIIARMPTAQADRIEDGTLIGVNAGGSFAWVIPTDSGVVLVDAGWSGDAAEILAEIGERKVLAILLTHGHFDHTGGLGAFPDVPVYVGPGEEALVRRKIEPKGWMARLSTKMINPPIPNPSTVIEFVDGQELSFDGVTIRAVHTPGHTDGSAMYIWNDTLFSGDSIVGRGERVNETPRPTSDDYDQIRLSAAKVLDYQFDRMADGHVGLHKAIRTQVETYINNP
jgi:glyoxylase-like metal-dependent hydrolase (beta-lactamase superfamily II)